jgi:pyruvate,water dikinase
MVNVGNPDVPAAGLLPTDGVPARMEFIVAEHIKVHPMALVTRRVDDPAVREQIARLTQGFSDPPTTSCVNSPGRKPSRRPSTPSR